jgi:UMF1 family MFS transporter
LPLTRGESAWTLTEAANEPFFNLVQRYVFAPYFAGTLAAEAADGAALWGYALGAAGFAIAILAPVFGAIADSGSRLKPWLAAAGLLAFVASASLWFAAPGASLLLVALAVFVAAVAVEFMNQFSNALLPVAATPGRAGVLSGLAFAISQAAGLLVLLFILWLSRADPPLLAGIPYATDRSAGPVAAAAVALFLTPFLFLGPDRPGGGPVSVARGLADLKATLAEAWASPTMRRFLLARMISADGMTVVFAFGAVLAAQTFGWEAGTLAVFGGIITVFGVVGGVAGAWLDRRIGVRRLVLLGLALLALGAASVAMTDEIRLFGIATGRALGEPLSTPQERGFLGAGALIATGAAFAIAGQRTMMAHLAPPARLAAYFGLYSFVGKATAFLGPLMVGLLASATGSIRPGIAVAVAFLLAGFALIASLRSEKFQLA